MGGKTTDLSNLDPAMVGTVSDVYLARCSSIWRPRTGKRSESVDVIGGRTSSCRSALLD